MTQHAYFYRPGTLDMSLLTGYTHVIFQSYDERSRDLLKDIGVIARYAIPQPEGPIELTRGTVPITDTQMAAWRTKSTWRNGPIFYYSQFVDRYHQHEEYFLHDSTGKRLYSVQGGRNFYLLRPKFAAKQFWADVAAIHAKYGWNHAYIDNVGIDDSKIDEVSSTPAQEYAGGDQSALYQDEWAAFLDEGRLAMPTGTLLFINAIGDWKAKRDMTALIDRADGVLLEAFGVGWPNMRKDWTPQDTLATLKRAQQIVDAGKHLICVLQCLSTDSAQYRAYAFALYCLVAGDNTSVRLVNDGKYGPIVKVPEMDLELGKAEEKYMQSGYVFTRDFEHYQLTVNIKDQTYSFVPWSEIEPEPVDPIAQLQQQVAAVLEREQQHIKLIEELQQMVGKNNQLVTELQNKLSNAKVSISF